MKRLYSAAAILFVFLLLGASAQADPVILTPGSPAVTFIARVSASGPGVNAADAKAQITASLSADGRTRTITFTILNQSTNPNLFIDFASLRVTFPTGPGVPDINGLSPRLTLPAGYVGTGVDGLVFSPGGANRPVFAGGSLTGTLSFTITSESTITFDVTRVGITADPRITPDPNANVPEPATMLLAGSGLVLLAEKARRRRKQQSAE